MNYLTIIMFLVISIIIFLLFLLVSGCKVDTAEYIWGKPLTTLPTLSLNYFTTTQASTYRSRISIIDGDYLANESGINFIFYQNVSPDLISSISTNTEECSHNVVKDSVVFNVISSQTLCMHKIHDKGL